MTEWVYPKAASLDTKFDCTCSICMTRQIHPRLDSRTVEYLAALLVRGIGGTRVAVADVKQAVESFLAVLEFGDENWDG